MKINKSISLINIVFVIIFFLINIFVLFNMKENNSLTSNLNITLVLLVIDNLGLMKLYYLVGAIYCLAIAYVHFNILKEVKNKIHLLLIIFILFLMTYPFLYLAK